nr:unnamed protein product [Callosobruchus chinensis]
MTNSQIVPPLIRCENALLRQYKKIRTNVSLPIHEDIPDLSLCRLRSRKLPITTASQLELNGQKVGWPKHQKK